MSVKRYLVGEELDKDAMLLKSVLENHHVFCIAGTVLDYSNHLMVLEHLLQILLQD